ncbi:MAG TPA: hypothetical protein VMR45_04955 [Patescibacteria group bacterium]|nr:hypothetical protein [Patescibacteria group bacterium]
MIFWIALAAAFGCAICNGVAAVLQKTSADKEARATSLQISFLWQLAHDRPYIIGILLDGLAWALTMVAVHTLPLFTVQPIIACSVAVTALVDRFILHHKLGNRVSLAIFCILAGLVLLTLTAAPEKAASVHVAVRWLIILAPLALAFVGSIFAKIQKRYATVVLGAIAGAAFGGTSVVGRAISTPHPYWQIIFDPLLWALLGYGLVGILLFSIALQRRSASVVNAVMITFETLVPVTIGLLFLGDTPKHGSWCFAITGMVLAFVGTMVISTAADYTNKKSK